MLLIVAFISYAFASPSLFQTPSIGSDCTQGTPKFKVYSLTANPWPIGTSQMSTNLTISGTLASATFINEIWISSSSPNNFENQQVLVAQQYPKGNSTLNVVYNVQYPAGNWNAILTTRDGSFNILNCWTFSYVSEL